MIGIYVALALLLLAVSIWAMFGIGVGVIWAFLAMVWRHISPSIPPWGRNHIGLNHGNTADSMTVTKNTNSGIDSNNNDGLFGTYIPAG